MSGFDMKWKAQEYITYPEERKRREMLELRLLIIIWSANRALYTALFGRIFPGTKFDHEGWEKLILMTSFRSALMAAFPLDPYQTPGLFRDNELVLLILTIIVTKQDLVPNIPAPFLGRMFYALFKALGQTYYGPQAAFFELRKIVASFKPVFEKDSRRCGGFSEQDFDDAGSWIVTAYTESCVKTITLDNSFVLKVFKGAYDPTKCHADPKAQHICARFIHEWPTWFTHGGKKGTHVMWDIQVPLSPVKLEKEFGVSVCPLATMFGKVREAKTLCWGCQKVILGRCLDQNLDVWKVILAKIESPDLMVWRPKGVN